MEEHDEEGESAMKKGGAPRKYVPLRDVYSATSPRVTATGLKKVKSAAGKQLVSNGRDQSKHDGSTATAALAGVKAASGKRAVSNGHDQSKHGSIATTTLNWVRAAACKRPVSNEHDQLKQGSVATTTLIGVRSAACKRPVSNGHGQPKHDYSIATGTLNGVKVAAGKWPVSNVHDQLKHHDGPIATTILNGVYSRRSKHDGPITSTTLTEVYSRRLKRTEEKETSFLHSMFVATVKSEEFEEENRVKRRRVGSSKESIEMGVDCKGLSKSDAFVSNSDKIPRKRRNYGGIVIDDSGSRKQKNDVVKDNLKISEVAKTKKWLRLNFEGIDPKTFIGLVCKVNWPLDAIWYQGRIAGYDSETRRHQVKYDDGDEENLILSNQRIKFHVSLEEMTSLNLNCCEKKSEVDGIDVDEMMVLAASLNDCPDIEHGDVIWAKITGYAVWPAVVLDNSHAAQCKGLNKKSGENSVLVQFFGTHDFARVQRKQVTPFIEGLLSSCHSKCKKPSFVRGLEEAKMYLSERKVPEKMLQSRDGIEADSNNSKCGPHENGTDLSDEDCLHHDDIRTKFEDLNNCPLEEGELQVLSLGKIVKDSDNFENERFIWPEGYTAARKFPSVTDPSVKVLYKMEVLRDVDSKTRPLFRVTTDNGEEFKGPTPSVCWNKIYRRIRATQNSNRDYKTEQSLESGSHMFGFTHPKVSKLIKEMSNSKRSLKSTESASMLRKCDRTGYKPVHVEWRDLDKCNVCHMDDEYENNLFLQCEKCRMMVHAKCYGEPEPSGGALWLCNLCRPGAPESPLCCLCPVIGGAMKPTTDGRWAHLACAIWIPETCLSDVKKMEPIDGLHRINKDRWKLSCCICRVAYGACIQCSNNACRVAFHPLCARAAGFCLEPENVDGLHSVPFDEDGEDQCIQLLSFCRRHRPSSKERLPPNEHIEPKPCELANYTPEVNPSGCARSEPYDFHRKRKNEAVLAAASSSKRMHVQNMPYLIGGLSPNLPLWNKMSSKPVGFSKYSIDLEKLQLETTSKILSVADKYNHMNITQRKRLAFGKSGIHGFGVFTKLPHRAGDMVIEYTGEIIRRPVADRREHLLYNSLVGAGTYMFRIDDERVIDATKAGSIAHLINHSCEPNCYSRSITINGVDHIIIFAKRDLKQWEELTYDYRFASSDERLVCNCGSTRCRGVVNDKEAEERFKKLYVPASEVTDWNGED